MLPRADLTPTRPPASLEAATRSVASTDVRLEVLQRLTQISIGRELQATVESMLDDGTFLVKVADATARMALPVGTKVGDTLSMIFIAKEPRPTFLLTQQQGSAPASLSTTARLIDHVLKAASHEGEQPAVIARTPLVSSPAALEPKQVAAALHNTIASSGLFYESHLHEWISGSRPGTDLAQEPQSRMAASATRADQAIASNDAAQVDLTKLAAHMREVGDGAQKLVNLIREAQIQPANVAVTDADLITSAQPALPTLEPEAARLINLQLNTLENQMIRWQGQLWPGQPMEWEISEDKPDGNGRAQQQESAWTSTVRFELPHLGDISATIRLVGERVHVQVNTRNDETAVVLRQFGGLLADALEAAGAPLDSLSVKQDESP